MPGRKEFAGGAAETTLSGGISNSADSLQVDDASGYPVGTYPFVIVVGVGTANEEKMLAGGRSGNTFTDLTRGYDDTQGVAHQPGERVRHVLDSDTVDEANAHVNTTTRDDHTQYLRTDGTRALSGTSALAGSPGDSAPGDAAAAGSGVLLALADHTHGRESVAELADLIFPAGTILEFAGSVLPTGFLWADGAEVAKATYPAMWTAMGETHLYGTAGDPTNNFLLPDRRDRVAVGKAASGTRATLGATGGSHDAVVVQHNHTGSSAAETAEHVHALNHTHSLTGGNHTHAMDGDYGFRFGVSLGGANHGLMDTYDGVGITFSDVDHENILSPGDGGTALAVSAQNGNSQGRSATHTHGVTVNNNGVAGTDKNLPKYIVCNFIVKVH